MENYVVRAIAREVGIRGLACNVSEIAQATARRHQATSASAAVLGYGLTGAALLGSLLKVRQHVAIKIEGSRALRKLVAESDSYGHIRAYITPADIPGQPPIGPAEVAVAVGQEGLLTVVKDLGVKDLYESVVPLQTGRLDADLTYYLMKSEQVPSFVEIGVPVDTRGAVRAAGGLLLQVMPDGDVSALSQMADRLDDLPPLGEMLAAGETPEYVLDLVFGGQPYEVLETFPLEFRCSCSRERSERAIRLIGAEEVASLVEEGEAIIDCQFCHERYIFDRAELGAILDDLLRESAG